MEADRQHTTEEMTCQELVELVTDYLEGALDARDERRFEEHLRTCPHCVGYVEQIRIVAGTLRGIDEQQLPAEMRDRLMTAFREWRRAGAGGR